MPDSGKKESVKYGNFKFIGNNGFPSPLITISKEYTRDGGGRQIGSTINISLEGKIFATGVSANNSTIESWSEARFTQLQNQEQYLRSIFGVPGKTLTVGCGTNNQTFDNIKINKYSANKGENFWTTTIDYSIDLVSEVYISGTGIASFLVTSTQDDWSIEPVDEFLYTKFDKLSSLGFGSFSNPANNNFDKYPMYRVSRTLGAVGKYVPSGEKTALQNAKDWVDYHLDNNEFKATGIISNLNLYNFVRNVNKSESDGTYKITDTWLAGENTSPYTETFTIETSLDAAAQRNVEIKGTVKGLEPYNTGISNTNYLYNSNMASGGITGPVNNNFRLSAPSNNKFYYAMSGYSGIKDVIYNRVSSFVTSNLQYPTDSEYNRLFNRNENTINPIPVSITEGFSPSEGSITYSYSYNNRPVNAINGSISESLTINDNKPIPLVASIFVLGRKLGPILQNLGTVSSSTRRVTFEIVLPTTGIKNISFPLDKYNQMNNIINQFKPTTSVVIVKEQSSDWNISENRLVRDITWEYSNCT